MTKRTPIAVTAAALLILAALHLWGPSSVPPGQKALATLSAETFGEFESAFDAGADMPRVLLLLSPT